MKKLIVLLAALLIPLVALPALAGQVRVFVAEINAIGVKNRDEMKVTLQTLLASRLTNDSVVAVGSAAEADILVTGTYVTIGKVFSVDALAKTASGTTVTRAFVQGESQDELIPAVGKLAEKLTADLARMPSDSFAQSSAPKQAPKGSSEIIRQNQAGIHKVPPGEIIRQEPKRRTSAAGEKGWISKALPGAANVMAVGETLPDGEREIFLGQNNKVQYFRQGDIIKLMATAEFGPNEKVISVDAVDGDGDGRQELYITLIRSGDLVSQVWEVRGDKLSRIAADLPYYFHAISLGGGAKKLYLQEMAMEQDFYGPVYEASRKGATITKKNPIKMPRYGTLYNYNQFKNRDGELLSVVIGADNYLIVYDKALKEIWRSNDRFGGTDLYFEKEDNLNVRETGARFRKIYLDMRIQVTAKNEILVGKNEGFMSSFGIRNYKKGAVYCFEWDESSLDELWRTREVQNFAPDYWYDEGRLDLLLLMMPLKPGPGEDGTASLAIKKVE